MVVGDPHLKDTLVEIAHPARFRPPGQFQFFMGFEIVPGVEQLNAFASSRGQRFLAHAAEVILFFSIPADLHRWPPFLYRHYSRRARKNMIAFE